MADAVVVTVKGLPEVIVRFQRATFDLQGASAKRAVGAAARNTARVAQRNAPIGSYRYPRKKGESKPVPGTLKRAIIGHWSPKRSKEYLVHVGLVRVKSGKKLRKRKGGSQDAFYAGWVEFGHRTVPRRKGKYSDFALRGLGRATGIAARRRAAFAATAAGTRATTPGYPFLKPAWEATKVGALRIIEETLRRDLNKAGVA